MIYGKNYNCQKEHYLRKYKDAELIQDESSEDIYKPDKEVLKGNIKDFIEQKLGTSSVSFTENEDTVIDDTTNAIKSQAQILIKGAKLKNKFNYYVTYDYLYKNDNTYTIFYIMYKSFEKIQDYATKNSLIPKLLYTTDIIREVCGEGINLLTKVISLEYNEETGESQFSINNIDLHRDFKPYDLNKYYPLYYEDEVEPQPTYSRKCKKCGFRNYCKVPKLSIADLESTPNCWRTLDPIIKKYPDLSLENLTKEDIEKLTDKQQARYYAYLSQNGIYIEKDNIRKFLDKLFLSGYVSFDFETYSSVLPIDKKYKTYAQIPFSYSLDLVSRENKMVSHNIYVTDYKENNFDKLIEQLVADMPTDLPIVVYFKTFEEGRLKEFQNLYPQYAEVVQKWIDNLVDLYDVFNNGYYYDVKFGNSISLKSTYPTLCGNKYSELEINKGDKAALNYKMIFNDKEHKDAQKIMKELAEYNSQDTAAQIEIIEKLKNIIDY